jgi:hypothetical protein
MREITPCERVIRTRRGDEARTIRIIVINVV